MTRIKTIVFTIIGVALMFFTAAAVAQEITVSARVDQTSIALGDQIVYTLTISGSARPLPYPQLPDFSEFTVVAGPSTTQQTISINNQVTVSEVYNVVLQPKTIGQFTISPTIVRYKENEYKSEPFTITVQKEISESLPPELAGENVISARSNNADLNRMLKGRLFLRTVVSKQQPYVGEPIIVSYYLYNDRIGLTNLGIVPPEPEYKDFLKEDLYSPRELQWKDTALGNRTYKVALLKRIALVPTKTGKFTVDPFNLGGSVRLQSTRRSSPRSPFDRFFDDPFQDSFFGDVFERNVVSVSIPSSPQEIEVLPLPTPQPQNFSGTVGDYTISAETDRTEATEDDLVTLRVKIKGTGYAPSITEPTMPKLDGLEVYGSKATVNRAPVDDKTGGEKIFEYVLRPRRPGTRTIPSFDYTIFNPTDAKYEALRTPEIALTIKPGAKQAPLVVAASQGERGRPQDVIQLSQEINYIKTTGLSPQPTYGLLYKQPWFLALQALPLLAVGIAYFVRRRRDMLDQNAALARTRAAKGVARKRLRTAAQHLRSGDADRFCAELASALRGYVADKCNLSSAGLTTDEIGEQLRVKNIEDSSCEETRRILEQCDAARYAPSSIDRTTMDSLYERASRLVNSLEKRLGS